MTRDLHFFVEGQPVPKARPRVVDGHAYTPQRTSAWERTVAWTVKYKMRGQKPLTGPVSVDLVFYGARKNADTDNLAKAVLDAMNGLAYLDDKQVVHLEVTRVSDEFPDPGVNINVTTRSPLQENTVHGPAPVPAARNEVEA